MVQNGRQAHFRARNYGLFLRKPLLNSLKMRYTLKFIIKRLIHNFFCNEMRKFAEKRDN